MEKEQAVSSVVDKVAELLSPRTVVLYNQKHSPKGDLTAFKLCVIAETTDKSQAEQALYRGVDSDIPFDILLYTPEEWARLIGDPRSFASHIEETGMVVYG